MTLMTVVRKQDEMKRDLWNTTTATRYVIEIQLRSCRLYDATR